MNGINIIAKHFCRETNLATLIIGGSFVTVFVIISLIIYWKIYKDNNSLKNIIIGCSIAMVSILALFWYLMIDGYNITHMEYTITIDDTVGFNEFNEKYEIISVNDNKYRVKEK